MKAISKLLGMALLASAITFTSCKKEDESPTDLSSSELQSVTVGGVTYQAVEGHLTSDLTLKAGSEYLLTSGVYVDEGVTLTIEAGAKVYAADDESTPFISVQRGGMIDAQGTASDPIVLTSVRVKTNPTGLDRGLWGGIIINGNVKNNQSDNSSGEGGTGQYGGTADASESSGTLKYVRVEFAGKLLSEDNELNGFSFNSVGSGTTLEYLQAFKGADDGFEFFGGTANIRYALSTANKDDAFDWTDGWTGKGQFLVVQQDAVLTGDSGIEGDNSKASPTAIPISNPTLANLTFVGDGDSQGRGIRIREGSLVRVANALVTNFDDGLEIADQGNTAVDTDITKTDKAVVRDSYFWDIKGTDATFKGLADGFAFTGVSTTAQTLTGVVGEGTSTYNSSSLGSWFKSAQYAGAITSSDAWHKTWALKADGTAF